MKVKNIFTTLAAALVGMAAVCSCDNYLGIDDDRDDCGYDFNITYRVNLDTNKDEEISNKLYAPADAFVRAALQSEWNNIFRAYSKDLNLSFYKMTEDVLDKQETYNDFDSNEKSYTIFLDNKKYRHLALGNTGQETAVTTTVGDNSTSSKLQSKGGLSMENQHVGLFTGRADLEAGVTKDNNYIVNLYQANSSAALVLDTIDAQIVSVRMEMEGMASTFNIADSTYTYNDASIVEGRQLNISAADSYRLCYYAVSFPSHDKAQSTDEPVWRMNVYVELPDGTTTKNELKVYSRLRAGYVKIIKAKVYPDGALEITDADIGASVMLDWKEGGTYNPQF